MPPQLLATTGHRRTGLPPPPLAQVLLPILVRIRHGRRPCGPPSLPRSISRTAPRRRRRASSARSLRDLIRRADRTFRPWVIYLSPHRRGQTVPASRCGRRPFARHRASEKPGQRHQHPVDIHVEGASSRSTRRTQLGSCLLLRSGPAPIIGTRKISLVTINKLSYDIWRTLRTFLPTCKSRKAMEISIYPPISVAGATTVARTSSEPSGARPLAATTPRLSSRPAGTCAAGPTVAARPACCWRN